MKRWRTPERLKLFCRLRLTDIEVGGVQTYELNCECEWQAEKKRGEGDD